MRLERWVLFVVSLSVLGSLSCRKTVAPNTDRNRAPETYLTAAPLDSIGGGTLNRAPYRYRAHWSGSDIDGQVVGFYVAVTETIPGARIPLPPPKPQQWRFTAQTDSTFIFTIHEGLGTDREHGLYVFAVDNEGRTDPTPAFTRFVARDRNLPGIVWITHRAEGVVFLPAAGGGVVETPWFRDLTDSQDPVGATFPPRDTLPVGAGVFFEWVGYDNDWQSQILGYRYKLYEPDYVKVDVTGTSAQYGTGVGPGASDLPIGLNVFRVRAVDEAGGTTFPDSLRRLVVNFDPETWWYGPDTTDAALQAALLRDGRGLYVPSSDGSVPAALNPWLGADRFCTLPADRKSASTGQGMRTFLEKVKIRVGAVEEYRFYVHADSDTVARNCDAVYLFAGGSDKDSPFAVFVQPGNPPTDKCAVGTPGPANGSPIGFEFRIPRLSVKFSSNNPAFSAIHPNFNPLAAGYKPEIYFTDDQKFTGASFAVARAVDGNLGKDRRVRQPIDYMFAYRAGTLSPEQAALRPLILTWFVNFNPYFLADKLEFAPRPDTLITDPIFKSKLYMVDPDSTTSGPDKARFLVRVRIISPDRPAPVGDEGWQPPTPFPLSTGDEFPIAIPTDIPPGRNQFEFELSDFPSMSLEERRIVFAKIPFYWLTKP